MTGARIPRLLLAIASLLMLAGSASHAGAFPRALAAVAASDLAPFFANSLEVLWLADSTTMLVVGSTFGLLAVRPSLAGRPVVIALGMIPAATGALIYTFLGGFFAGHLLLVTAALAVCAGLRWPDPTRLAR